MYEIKKTVQFEDIDIYGIIHHPKVLYYFERLRNSFFEKNGINLNKIDYGIVIKKIKVDYKAPLAMFDNITIRQTVDEVRDYKFVLKYLITKKERLMVCAKIDFVTMDLNTKKIIPIPDEILLLLNNNKNLNLKTDIYKDCLTND